MKLSAFLIAAVAAPAALADFSVFFLHQTGWPNPEVFQWAVYDSTPRNFNEWSTKRKYPSRSDVSGSKVGVRCQGSGCGANYVRDVDQLEMHFSNHPLYHFTIYKNRNWKMYGLDGREYGSCEISTGNDFDFEQDGRRVRGYRKYRCRSPFTAAQINTGTSS